jgi:two-component system OmpR family sensor kinase
VSGHALVGRLRRFVSDRRKVMVTVLLLTAATFVVAGVATVRTTRNQLVSRTDAALRAQLQTARDATRVLSPAQLAELSPVSKLVAPNYLIVVVDGHGHPVWSASGLAASKRPTPQAVGAAELRAGTGRAFTVSAPNGGSYRALSAGLGNGQVVVYASPLAPVHQTVHDLIVTVVVIGLIAASILAFVLWRFLAAASKPVDTMIGVAAQIGRGDLTARIDDSELTGEARRLGVALNQMVARLEHEAGEKAASEERLRQFVADASHELRTPITNIRGYAQLSAMGASDDPTVAMERIEAETDRMSVLVQDLLTLARFDQGRVAPREPLDLADLVREVVHDAQVVEPDRVFRFRDTSEQSTVVANADDLRRVFQNLLANVRVHAPGTATCDITLDSTPSEVWVTVTDHGPGMAPEVAARAFDRFFRADESRTRDSGGSGLGLAISQALVTAHGGTIHLTSVPGTGTTVAVGFPRHLVEQPREPATTSM